MKLAMPWAAQIARVALLAAALTCLAGVLMGCVYQRAEQAAEAQKAMNGATKSHVLDCMGQPDETLTDDRSETLTYYKHPVDADARLFCSVDVVVSHGLVSRVNYNGNTGGLLTRDEQCAPIVAKCVATRQTGVSDKVIDFFKF